MTTHDEPVIRALRTLRAMAAYRGYALPRCTVCVGDAAEFPAARDYAYCAAADEALTIVYAPKMLHADQSRVLAVLAHEYGHAAMLANGEIQHTERDADKLAEALFGVRISYDRDLVQTTGPGLRPRPASLPR